MLSFRIVMLNAIYAECRIVMLYCIYAECRIVMLNIIYAGFRSAECHYTACRLC